MRSVRALLAAGCHKAVICPRVLHSRRQSCRRCISACGRFGTDEYCCRGSVKPVALTPSFGLSITLRVKRAEPSRIPTL